jgi:hypothetical protein
MPQPVKDASAIILWVIGFILALSVIMTVLGGMACAFKWTTDVTLCSVNPGDRRQFVLELLGAAAALYGAVKMGQK